MTTKYITTYVAAGYTITSGGTLKVTPTGGIGGAGLTATAYTDIFNHGKIANTNAAQGTGVYLEAGGYLNNSGTIAGGYYGDAIISKASARIFNSGRITGGSETIYLKDGGGIYNGGYEDSSAIILGGVGVSGGIGHINNAGTITGGVALELGGGVVNGSGVDTSAFIGGGVLADATASTVTNFGSIAGLSIINIAGVGLANGGVLINGSGADTTARITAANAVVLSAAGTVSNFGVITGTSSQAYTAGVDMAGGGGLTNGSATDRVAVVAGYSAIVGQGGASAVVNFATIEGLGVAATEFGIDLKAGGTVTNGGGPDRSALIAGATGISITGGYGTIKNFATVSGEGGAGSYGAVLGGAGYIVNGSRNNGSAVIEGYAGAALNAPANTSSAVYNFGTIVGLGDGTGGVGVALGVGGARLINNAGAVVEGDLGVLAGAYAVVENYGTIRSSGVAVEFTSANDTLVVEAGSAFVGVSLGDGGTLDLGSGTGTISNFANGSLTVSGSMAPASFDGFNVIEVAAGATFTDAGAVTIALGQSLDDAGALSLGGAGTATIANAGVLEVAGSGTLVLAGAVAGKGSATIAGGTLEAASSFNQNVTFSGTTGELVLAQSQGYTGSVSGFSKSGKTSFDLLDIKFVSSTEATFAGNSKGGVLTVSDGTHTAHITLKGNYVGSTWIASSDGNGGTIVIDPKAKAPGASIQPFVAAMSGLQESDAAPLPSMGPSLPAWEPVLTASRHAALA